MMGPGYDTSTTPDNCRAISCRRNRGQWTGPATRAPYGFRYLTHFDKNSVYGNEVNMDAAQEHHLQQLIGTTNPAIKYYICTINKTFATSTQRMYFSMHFTKQFLLPFLNPNVENLRIKLGGSSIKRRVRLIKGTDGRATITTNWGDITTNWGDFTRAATITQGDIFAFVFTTYHGRLRLTANRL